MQPLPPPDPRLESPLVLTPPEPAAAVPRESAIGLVPLGDQVASEMAATAAEYVDSLTELGAGEIRGAAQQSNRMLERTVRALSDTRGGPDGQGGDAQGRVSSSLVELRRTVEDLDPRERPGRGARKLPAKLPGGNKLRDHVARYASAQSTLNKIVGSLRSGQDELRRDNASLHTERVRLWETMGKLQEYTVLTDALDQAVTLRVAEAEALRADVLFPVRQKHQDLLTQLAVCAQGYLAMDVVRRNNDELIKGVERAATTTVSALRIAVMLSAALENQRRVVEQVNALRGTTEELIRANAEMLATQSGEIQRIAADPAVGAETLRAAFQQIYQTLDTIDTYKARATDAMAATVASLTDELQTASAHIERARSKPELGGDHR